MQLLQLDVFVQEADFCFISDSHWVVMEGCTRGCLFCRNVGRKTTEVNILFLKYIHALKVLTISSYSTFNQYLGFPSKWDRNIGLARLTEVQSEQDCRKYLAFCGVCSLSLYVLEVSNRVLHCMWTSTGKWSGEGSFGRLNTRWAEIFLSESRELVCKHRC